MTYKTKPEIVTLILSQAKGVSDFQWHSLPTDKIVYEWFVTGRQGSGLRLTDAGMQAFKVANIAHYDFAFTPDNNHAKGGIHWAKYTLLLDKKIDSPYYIGMRLDEGKKQPYIRLYDHKIAMMMTLYGSLPDYLDSIRKE